MAVNHERIRSGFVGALLGTFVGDALGAPLEGRAGRRHLKDGPVREMIDGRHSRGCYTDDTQMMIALAEALIESDGEPTPELIIDRFLANYDPSRGYGWGAHKLMQLWKKGADWQQAACQIFPDGSFGNGAAMRIAPVGVLYHGDRAKLGELARLSAKITHAHPLGVQGALLQAHAIGLAIRYRRGGTLSPANFILDLLALARDEFDLYREKLLIIKDFLDSPRSRSPNGARKVARALGVGFTAPDSVPTAIFSFLIHHSSFEDAVVFAVNLGGDADTIGAMCGAVAGAYLGIEAIPDRWLDALEDGVKGRTYVSSLADRLFELWLRRFRA